MKFAVAAAAVAVLLGGAGLLGWRLLAEGDDAAPAVDPVLAGAVLPVIDDRLQHGPWQGILASERPDLRPRWFCAEHIIEIRQEAAAVQVGLDALCQEYASSGGALLRGSGDGSPKYVVLSADRQVVQHVESPPDGSVTDWARRTLSTAGAAELVRRQNGSSSGLVDAAEAEARRTFGLPADAPVLPGPR